MKKLFLILVIYIFMSGANNAQESIKKPVIGSKAPTFSSQSTYGKSTITDYYCKSWKVLLNNPQDLTFICSSELLEQFQYQDKFKKLDVVIIFTIMLKSAVKLIFICRIYVKYLD